MVSRDAGDARAILGVSAECRDRDGERGSGKFRAALERLAGSADAVVAEAARWALERV